MSDIESDDQDWFNKDEEQILQSLQFKVKNELTKDTEANIEYIQGPSETGMEMQ